MTRREALARHLAMIGPHDPWPKDPRHAYEWADQILELLGDPA